MKISPINLTSLFLVIDSSVFILVKSTRDDNIANKQKSWKLPASKPSELVICNIEEDVKYASKDCVFQKILLWKITVELN